MSFKLSLTHIITAIIAVALVGYGGEQQSVRQAEAQKETPTAKAPVISIHGAVEEGNVEAVKQHLVAGTDINLDLGGGWTPLHSATDSGHKEIVELLIVNGANVNAEAYGATPLDIAMELEQHEIADILSEHGAKSYLNRSIFIMFYDMLIINPLPFIILALPLIVILVLIYYYIKNVLRSGAFNLDRANKLNKISNMLNVEYSSDGKDKLDKHFSFSKISPKNAIGRIISESVASLMEGEVSNARFAIFDLEYTTRSRSATGGGYDTNTYKYTPIYFRSTHLNLPHFTLRPEVLGDKIASIAHLNLTTFKSEYQDVDFTSHPEFSKSYLLQGEDEENIRAIFTAKLLDYFLTHEKITVEGKGNILIVYRDSFLGSDNRIATDEWTAFMDAAYQVFQQFAGSSETISLLDILKSAGK